VLGKYLLLLAQGYFMRLVVAVEITLVLLFLGFLWVVVVLAVMVVFQAHQMQLLVRLIQALAVVGQVLAHLHLRVRQAVLAS
jgi:hypothetical protein